jgi:hypothetical protein
MNIPEEAIQAVANALFFIDRDSEPGTRGLYERRARAAIEAATPLIAAQVLRDAMDVLRSLAEQTEATGDVFDLEAGAGVREAVEALARTCPLCGGKGMNHTACAGCGKQADPPVPCRRCGRTSHGFACS